MKLNPIRMLGRARRKLEPTTSCLRSRWMDGTRRALPALLTHSLTAPRPRGKSPRLGGSGIRAGTAAAEVDAAAATCSWPDASSQPGIEALTVAVTLRERATDVAWEVIVGEVALGIERLHEHDLARGVVDGPRLDQLVVLGCSRCCLFSRKTTYPALWLRVESHASKSGAEESPQIQN